MPRSLLLPLLLLLRRQGNWLTSAAAVAVASVDRSAAATRSATTRMLSVAKSLFMVFNKLPQNDFERTNRLINKRSVLCATQKPTTTHFKVQLKVKNENIFRFFSQVIKVLRAWHEWHVR